MLRYGVLILLFLSPSVFASSYHIEGDAFLASDPLTVCTNYAHNKFPEKVTQVLNIRIFKNNDRHIRCLITVQRPDSQDRNFNLNVIFKP